MPSNREQDKIDTWPRRDFYYPTRVRPSNEFFSRPFSHCASFFSFFFFSIVDSIINCVVFHSESRLFDSSASVSKPGDILCYCLFIFIGGINSVQGLKNVKDDRLLDYTRPCQLWRLY